ncbi:hypothetical protein D3C78_967380 [compost metagenome]
MTVAVCCCFTNDIAVRGFYRDGAVRFCGACDTVPAGCDSQICWHGGRDIIGSGRCGGKAGIPRLIGGDNANGLAINLSG